MGRLRQREARGSRHVTKMWRIPQCQWEIFFKSHAITLRKEQVGIRRHLLTLKGPFIPKDSVIFSSSCYFKLDWLSYCKTLTEIFWRTFVTNLLPLYGRYIFFCFVQNGMTWRWVMITEFSFWLYCHFKYSKSSIGFFVLSGLYRNLNIPLVLHRGKENNKQVSDDKSVSR